MFRVRPKTREWQAGGSLASLRLQHCLGWLVIGLVGCSPQSPPAPPLVSGESAHAMAEKPAPSPVPASSSAPPPTHTARDTTPLLDALPQLVERLREVPSAACLARRVTPKTKKLDVHRWVDAAGITHYSDRKPPQDARDLRTIAVAREPVVAVQASGYDTNLPGQLQQRAVADALAVERVMHETLGVAMPEGLSLRIVFVRSPQAYANLIEAPELANSAGVYSTATKTIHVRMQASEEADFFVLRHEIVHALVHEAIGDLPVALNEGLAEYFGRYRAAGTGGQVDLAAERGRWMAAAPEGEGSDALVDLLAPEGAAFYRLSDGATAREMRYRRAFALVALLMGDAQGRATLSALLAAQARTPCEPIAVEQWLDRSHPGGLAALAVSWARFMRQPPSDVRAY